MSEFAIVSISITVSLLLYFLLQMAKRPAIRDAESGTIIMQFGRILPACMYFFGVVGVLMMVALFFVVRAKEHKDHYGLLVIGPVFFLLCAGVAKFFSSMKVHVSSTTIASEGMFTKNRKFDWQDVKRFRFHSDGSVSLEAANKTRIGISNLMVGIADFATLLEEHLPAEAKVASDTDLNKFRKMIAYKLRPFGL